MAGIFDYANHPGTGENQRTLNPSFLCGCMQLRLANIYTANQLRDEINLELGASGPLDAAALQDLTDLRNWINAGTTIDDKLARLSGMCATLGLYEQSRPSGVPWLTEAQARTLFTTLGVAWS